MNLIFTNQEPTRTESTEESYILRSEQLLRRAAKDLGVPGKEIDLLQFAVWLSEKKTSLARTAWRQYKSAAIYYCSKHPDLETAAEAADYLKCLDSVGCLLKTDRTSGSKLKKISLEDWQTLDSWLAGKPRKWHNELRNWLRSAIITGLRPVEWKTAKLTVYEGEPALLVDNAKNTNGRSHGATRTLLLRDLNNEDLIAIKKHLNNVKTFIGMSEYEYFYRGCAVALYKICRKIWPRRRKHITLYSTRHQFSANAKSTGFSKSEVAAMMGHAVDVTATIHYGKKTAGNEAVSIFPLDEEVERIKKIPTADYDAIKKSIKNATTQSTIQSTTQPGTQSGIQP